jgi:hypothetical protein
MSFAPYGQFLVARRPSLVGSQEAHGPSIPLLVRPGLPKARRGSPSTASAQPPTRASAYNVQASEPRASARRPSPSVPWSRRQAAPHHRPPASFSTSWASAPDERPPPRRRVLPRPIPTQTRASATGGFKYRPTKLGCLLQIDCGRPARHHPGAAEPDHPLMLQ